MKKHKVFKISRAWSNKKLIKETEEKLDELERLGYEIVGVSFNEYAGTCYITTKK